MNLPNTSSEVDTEITGKINPKFLDIVENGWASKDNPHRVGIFIKKKTKTLLLTDGKGEFFEPFNDDGSKLRIIGNLLRQSEIKGRIDEVEKARYEHLRNFEEDICVYLNRRIESLNQMKGKDK